MYSLKERLTEILIKEGVITEEQLKKSLKAQRQKGGSLKNILVELGFVSEKDLIAALSRGLGIPPIALSRFRIAPDILKLIPRDVAKKYQIVPVSRVGNVLTVAMSDPLNVFAIDDVRSVTGLEIGTIITSQKEVEDAIEQHYSEIEVAHEALEELVKDIRSDELELIETKTIEKQVDSTELFKLVEEAPVVKLTNKVLENGIKARASDILIEPLEGSLRIRYRVDGVLKEGGSLSRSMCEPIVSRIKVMSQLNIAERRLPQDGRFKLRIDANEIDFRVSILPSSGGEKVALRVLDKSLAMLDIERLGFEDDTTAVLKKCASHPHGMILVCGPTGSGKTTTLYSLLKYVHEPGKNLITVEDPVEYQIKGVNQVTVRSDVGLTFASALRSILRQDPDVIMIGEIRDFETVDTAIKSALTGHLVLSTLHTTTTCGSVVRLINMGVEPFLISSSLIAIVAQRLIRRLCPRCKQPYSPTQSIIDRYGIRASELYKGKGCDQCFNTGYSGRIGICEVLVMHPTIREMILKRARESELKSTARIQGMRTLREAGVAKVIGGVTSLEEVLRVTVADE